MTSTSQQRSSYRFNRLKNGEFEIHSVGKEKQKRKGINEGHPFALLSVGSNIAFGILIPILFSIIGGHWIDQKFLINPLGILCGVGFGLFGAIINTYFIIKNLE